MSSTRGLCSMLDIGWSRMMGDLIIWCCMIWINYLNQRRTLMISRKRFLYICALHPVNLIMHQLITPWLVVVDIVGVGVTLGIGWTASRTSNECHSTVWPMTSTNTTHTITKRVGWRRMNAKTDLKQPSRSFRCTTFIY